MSQNQPRRTRFNLSPVSNGRLIARRSRADFPLVVLYLVVVLVTVAIAIAAPRLVSQASESGLTQALSSQSDRAEVVADIELDDSHYNFGLLDPAMASDFQATTRNLHSRLSDTLGSVLAEPVVTVSTRSLEVPRVGEPPAALRLHYVWAEGASDVDWIEGEAPGTSRANPATARTDPVEVGFSESVARALNVEAGEQLTLTQSDNSVYTLAITGIFSAEDPADPVWGNAPGLIDPVVAPDDGVTRVTAGALLGEESMPVIRLQLPVQAMSAAYTFHVIPDKITVDDVEPLSAAVGALRSTPRDLSANPQLSAAVATDLDQVLAEYAGQLRAAKSQAAVVGAALGVVSALALMVCGGLLATRRRDVIELEIARGSTVTAVLSRIGVESLIVACVGAGLGAWLADLLVTRGGGFPSLVPLEMLVAVVAAPLAALSVLKNSGRPQKVAANRADRRRARAVTRVRRYVLEGAIVVAAAAACIAARSRGVTAQGTTSIDPLVVAAPILLALAITLIVVRLMPVALLGFRRAAAQLRGPIGLVAAARALAARFGGPAITALTLSLGMIMVCGTLATTVATSQHEAALKRTGADVLVRADDASITASAADIAAADGIDSVVVGRVNEDTQIRTGDTVTSATVIIVDARAYADQRESLGLPRLDTSGLDSDHGVSALVQRGAIDAGATSLDVYWNNTYVPVAVQSRIGALGEVPSPVIVIDAGQWSEASGGNALLDTMWVTGPGADAAVGSVPDLTDAVVDSRSERLETLRHSPLTSALTSLLSAGAWIFTLFGALVLVLWVLSSSTERSRTLSALRTLGLSRRAASQVSIAELLPTVASALMAATVIGVLVPFVLGPSIGLETLSGGDTPQATWSWFAAAVAATVAVLALLLTVGIESLLRRRLRLGQVLRVGAT